MAKTKVGKSVKETKDYTYVCSGCNLKFYDWIRAYSNVASTKCMWCARYPKKEKK